ncbi:hypothetical protein [uncultured Nisaea sp.]|jgi:hypothetical protein|uniref:hypothetical protein n=1 Tax=uncultured Nisaea sp. TaxID=538215 RepID=UPI0030ED9277|tara:strand:- start:2006 stop:2266 length:261 start_codon:yes stop_codon:yes gene_type:complete
MQDKEAREWLDFFMKQPHERLTQESAGDIPEVSSFVIDLVDDRFVVTFRFEDGRERAISLSDDLALYLREYLTTGLMEQAARNRPL